ncbi:DUF6087 family protein [Streptomyces albogriseolus]|uniref:DUF6087 family protein n=1 Tax=Streptomyces albogriseolus TaxID=1887 RepID=UPI003D72975D
MEDEPLEEWAAHRDQKRPRRGERRAVPLGKQGERAGHVDPDTPRGIQEWDGHEWIPAGIAKDHQTAAAEAGQDTASRAGRIPLPVFRGLPTAPEPFGPTVPWHRP